MRYSIHHLAITVSDIKTSMKFYAIFGFKKLIKYVDNEVIIAHFKLGNVILELFQYTNINPSYKKQNNNNLQKLGIKHISFGVKNLKRALVDMERNKIDIVIPITTGRTGLKYFFVKDPDGNMVEVVKII